MAAAIDCNGVVNFDIEDRGLEAEQRPGTARGDEPRYAAIDYSTIGGGSQVNIAYITISHRQRMSLSPLGLIAYANGFVGVTDSKIIAKDAGVLWGAASNGNRLHADRTVFARRGHRQ